MDMEQEIEQLKFLVEDLCSKVEVRWLNYSPFMHLSIVRPTTPMTGTGGGIGGGIL